MKQREGMVATGVIGVLLLTWLGFLVHRSPRFPGTGIGAAFGIAGAAFMLVPLLYPIAKRIPFLHAKMAPYLSTQSLLYVHTYAGLLGALFAIIHTGHKFDSLLGILLTTAVLLVVVSGFVGKYLLAYASSEIRDKLVMLQTARGDLDSAWGLLRAAPSESGSLPKAPILAAGLASLGLGAVPAGPSGEVMRTAESVADLEYAVRTHELFKRWCSRWLKLHIIVSVWLYLLLLLHVWAEIFYGLRWLR